MNGVSGINEICQHHLFRRREVYHHNSKQSPSNNRSSPW